MIGLLWLDTESTLSFRLGQSQDFDREASALLSSPAVE
jgi:hypothetical protein